MRWYRTPVWLVLSLLVVLLSACAAPSSGKVAGVITVRIAATENFGQRLLFDKTLEVPPGFSAMEALTQVAEVETAYGGGFVNAINGVRSGFSGSQGIQTDWFSYLNGMLSNRGALDYVLHDGDIQYWDFRDWSVYSFIPAIIGSFPEPFKHGYEGRTKPTIIAYAAGLEEDASRLERYLKGLGIDGVSSRKLGELSQDEKESRNLILLGAGNEEPLAELNRLWKRLGFFAYFKDGKVVTLNPSGKEVTQYGAGTGLIQATQNPWNPKGIGADENVVWLVSGTDQAGVKIAIDTLVERNTEFQFACGVVVSQGKIIRIPQ